MKDLMLVDLQPCDEYCRELFATCLDFLKTNEHRQHGAVVLSDGRLLASAETWQEQFFFLQNLTGQAQRLGLPVQWGITSIVALRQYLMDCDGMQRREALAEDPARYASLAQQTLSDMLFDAMQKQASDIHLQCRGDQVRVAYRIHGLLQQQASRNRTFISEVMAAAFNTQADDSQELFHEQRISAASFAATLPAPYGEVRVRAQQSTCQNGYTVTLRIQQPISTQAASFAELGFAPEAMLQLQAFSHLADGLVIFSGPTGHGKTTSLAAFNRLFPSSRKVISLEDPIEIIQDNIEQKFIAETLEPGSFARMVKVVLREDPDILAISEIRDAETAAAAVSASLTGHFVVSTIHASSPRAVLARLQDLKVDTDNLIANGILRGVIGQRLVPQLCPHCSLASEESLEFGRELQCDFGRELVSESVAKLRKLNPEGCAMCHFSGTAGRLLFAEIVSYVQVVGQTSGPTLAEQAAIAVLAGLVDLQHACEIVPDFHTYWQQNTHAASSV